ncbi:MAG: VWA domain-containing protein [Bacteroidales bacterium]|jgi:Ca-activated chloride channel family protein|nr:VWA domain-containing protein [Bacteroidales bacterium]
MNRIQRYISLLFLMFCLHFSFAQKTTDSIPPTRVLLIFDASMSMTSRWETETRMVTAKNILVPFIDSLSKIPNLEIALRIFGNRSPVPPQDCNDTHLEVPFSKDNNQLIITKILETESLGTTPIANSLSMATTDFPRDSTYRNIVFIITDGIEACDGDPCEVSRELQKRGVILKPFIIGVGNGVDWEQEYNCAGNVYSALHEYEFKSTLDYAMKKALTSTPLQIYLLDEFGKPRETNVPITFYDNLSGFIKYNFVHSLIKSGEPDIIFVDPLVSYTIKVHTIPPVFSDSVNLEAGKHTIVKIDVPQGYIDIKKQNGVSIENLQAIVRKSGKMNTLHIQKVGDMVKYLTGSYDIEILTMPRTYFYDVQVKQSETTKLTIPRAGKATFIKPTNVGHGAVYIDRNTDLELVAAFSEKYGTSETFYLQPGKYVVVWRADNITDTEKSISKRFEIVSGKSAYIQLK